MKTKIVIYYHDAINSLDFYVLELSHKENILNVIVTRWNENHQAIKAIIIIEEKK